MFFDFNGGVRAQCVAVSGRLFGRHGIFSADLAFGPLAATGAPAIDAMPRYAVLCGARLRLLANVAVMVRRAGPLFPSRDREPPCAGFLWMPRLFLVAGVLRPNVVP